MSGLVPERTKSLVFQNLTTLSMRPTGSSESPILEPELDMLKKD